MNDVKQIGNRYAVGMAPPSSEDLSQLARAGYKSVVNLRCENEPDAPMTPQLEGEKATALGLEYRNIPVAGDALTGDLVDRFRDCVKSLPGPLFVHCASGKRAGAFTMMHVAAENDLSGEAALAQAKEMGFACDQPALAEFVRDYIDAQRS